MIKKLLTIIGLTCMLASASIAQTNTAPASTASFPQAESLIDQSVAALTLSKILTVTNWALEPYLTYAPNLKANSSKVGGGALAVYNINNYVGAAVGVDYLGQFSLLSANATLKYEIPVSQYISLPKPINNLALTPFVLGGIGTPFGGGSASAATKIGRAHV